MKTDTTNPIIGVKDGKYFTPLSRKELNTLVSILEMTLGGFYEYKTPNQLDEDSVEEIYTQLVNISEFDPSHPYGRQFRPSSTARKDFIKSLDKGEVIAFLLKYGTLNRTVEVTRQIVAEQRIRVELPESIDANAYKKRGFGRVYDTPTEEYIYEELTKDDEYSYSDEQGELGWSEIGDYEDYDIGEYRYNYRFQIEITLPEISSYRDEMKEVA